MSGSLVPLMQVPAVTENCLEQRVHCHLRGLPLTGAHLVCPRAGQAKPPGYMRLSSSSSQASSVPKRPTHSSSVPSPPLEASASALVMLAIASPSSPGFHCQEGRAGTGRKCRGYAFG